ncbi:MAG: tetratricopeptide repeat protein [Bacteroidales bacterium]|nr:tetratricopeptide repeat protein [Bacteroidales bacterium]
MYEAALDEYTKAIALDPNEGKAYSNMALVNLAKGDTLLAAANLRKSAALGYAPEQNYLAAAQNYYTKNETDNALECIESGINLKPKNYEFWLLKAKIHFETGNYSASLAAASEAVKLKDLGLALYYIGASSYRLGNLPQAEKALEMALIRDKNLTDVYIELALLQIEQEKYDYAVDNCTMVLLLTDPYNIKALVTRSRAFRAMNEPEQSIGDITKAILLDKNNHQLYLIRAGYYADFALYSNAVDDYTIALGLNSSLAEAYSGRAFAYEQLNRKPEARADYLSLKALLCPNTNLQEIQFVENKIFELSRENNNPEVFLLSPALSEKSELKINTNDKYVIISGFIKDESPIKELKVNNSVLALTGNKDGNFEFEASLPVDELDFVSLTVVDAYENTANITYPIVLIEAGAPKISLVSPAPENSETIHLETGDKALYLEGKIEDDSKIVSIKIDEVNASFAPGDYNPRFTATIDIANRKSITISATDIFGNTSRQKFDLVSNGHLLSAANPMGKTWAVIIENTSYKEFVPLPNTGKDVKALQAALSQYKISKVLHMKDMSKREMERFFAIDLRDLILSNKVNSLMIWYAGHGKVMNNTGYWVPVDGRFNDEYSYYNINALKASFYSYSSLTHLLVVSDACSAGESFSIAMRGDNSLANCNDTRLVKQKSALVLTSSDSEASLDNTLFAQTFTNSLLNNPADCIPIDAIAERVSLVMQKNTVQKPVFGRISGLENNNGTFFFIRK